MTRFATALALLLLAFLSQASAADAPWGRPLDGLSCRLSGPSEVRQGDTLMVVLELRHDGANHGTITHIVDWPTWYCTTLEIVGADGRVHERRWPTGGRLIVPGHCTNNRWRDVGTPVDPDSFPVPTLGDDGDQLASGRYRVTAVYENRQEHIGGSSPNQPDTASIWSGRIRSEPITLDVTAGAEETVSFVAYTGVRRVVLDGKSAWEWDPATRQLMTASRRPGYHLGRILSLDGNRGGCGFSNATSGGLKEIDCEGSYLSQASPDTIRIYQWVGETSHADTHMWHPQSGDFRAFFESTIVIPPE
ncbi:MAG TPA: hypothetical protein VF720_13985 [Candidatus Eisenbacteria bacterium]